LQYLTCDNPDVFVVLPNARFGDGGPASTTNLHQEDYPHEK
jgi:hypothetical protein